MLDSPDRSYKSDKPTTEAKETADLSSVGAVLSLPEADWPSKTGPLSSIDNLSLDTKALYPSAEILDSRKLSPESSHTPVMQDILAAYHKEGYSEEIGNRLVSVVHDRIASSQSDDPEHWDHVFHAENGSPYMTDVKSAAQLANHHGVFHSFCEAVSNTFARAEHAVDFAAYEAAGIAGYLGSALGSL